MTRISATGRPNNNSRGFTLIEILIVLVIVAVMAGLLVFGLNDSPQRRLQREAGSLARLINAASDEAVMQGIEFGLVIDEEGYRFVYFDPENKRWQLPAQRSLAQRRFDEPLTIDIALDNERIDAEQRERIKAFAAQSEDTTLRPLVLMLSSGEVTAFTLTLGAGDSRVELGSDGINPVTVGDG